MAKNSELKDCNIPQKFFYNLNDINELNHMFKTNLLPNIE